MTTTTRTTTPTPPALLLLLLLLFLLGSTCVDAYAFQSRRAFFKAAATVASVTTTAVCVGVGVGDGVGVANAIDVSGLSIEGAAPGRAPNQPASGPLAGTKLGFQVGGGPRPEAEVRKIDEPRYKAATTRGGPNATPAFLDGVPREQPTGNNSIETQWTR